MKKLIKNFKTELKELFPAVPILLMLSFGLNYYFEETIGIQHTPYRALILIVLIHYLFFAFVRATCNEKYKD